MPEELKQPQPEPKHEAYSVLIILGGVLGKSRELKGSGPSLEQEVCSFGEEENAEVLQDILEKMDEESFVFFLQEIFPEVPIEDISNVLNDVNGDFAKAIEELLAREEGESIEAPKQEEVKESVAFLCEVFPDIPYGIYLLIRLFFIPVHILHILNLLHPVTLEVNFS